VSTGFSKLTLTKLASRLLLYESVMIREAGIQKKKSNLTCYKGTLKAQSFLRELVSLVRK